jgi:signal transduction histidine kinase
MLNLLDDADAERKRLELAQTAILNILEDFAHEKAFFSQIQTATLNILEDFGDEKNRLSQTQTAMLNILEDFGEEKNRLGQTHTATLNILEDFGEEKTRLAQMQTATLNILEDFDGDKKLLSRSQSAMLNILEDIDLEKGKVASAYHRIEAVNKELEGFAYAASHDLKAPLRVIDNTSRWLEEDLEGQLQEGTRDNMRLLRSRVARMEKLLDDLLEYSRIGRLTDDRFTEIVSGQKLLDDILAMIAPVEGFEVRTGVGLAEIGVHRMPLQHVLMNLIGNAIKHHDKKTGLIEVTVENSGDFYAFRVKDDGPGIPAQFHEQIFRMFQTLKPKDQVEGSGMGLAMVKKNVELYGGTVGLESEEGQGSIFSFTWPKAAAGAPSQIQTRGAAI